MANRSHRRRRNLYDRNPATMTRKRVRSILVEDALAGRITPHVWMFAAYAYLGRGTGQGADQALESVMAEVRSKGGVMPGAPGFTSPRSLP